MAKTPSKTKEVAPQNPGPQTTALATPALSKEEMQAMYGDMSREHVSIPRLVILEPLSPEVGEKEGAPGDFYVKGLGRNLGPGPVEVVVLFRNFSRMSWKPLSEGGGIICQAQDGKKGIGTPGGDCTVCPNKEWNGPIKPLCDLYENFIVILREDLKRGEGFPMAISGSRTKLKGLKDFNTMLMQLAQRKLPLFAKSYNVRGIEKNNPKIKGNNLYRVFGFSVGNDNKQLDQAEQKEAYEFFKTYSSRPIDIQQEHETSEVAAAGTEAQAF